MNKNFCFEKNMFLNIKIYIFAKNLNLWKKYLKKK